MKKKKQSIISKFNNLLFDNGEDDSHQKSSFSIVEVLFITLLAVLLGVLIGYFITKNNRTVIKNSHAAEIITTYNDILDNYYEEIDEETLAKEAIKGMVNSLEDPYSNYLDSDVSSTFEETVSGSFTGIGIVVVKEGSYNTIVEVKEESPAEKAGLKEQDRIIKVNDNEVKNIFGEDFSNLIKKSDDKTVTLTILRDGKEQDINITKKEIEIDTVISQLFDNIGYIKINTFSLNTYKQFNKELLKLEKEKISSLIIDVRDNPGGHTKQTSEILNMFFNKKTVLYQLESKNKKEKIYANSNEKRTYPVVVLINKNTASASEILASCFQEKYKKCTIVGENSYGKGSVQKTENLGDGTTIKYTTQKWLTPSGQWLNKKGITPDYKIVLSSDYYETFNIKDDNQLQKALELLKEESK